MSPIFKDILGAVFLMAAIGANVWLLHVIPDGTEQTS